MIVELVNRSGSVLDHFQFNRNEIRIGRAYDNDLILHDDHIDGHHLIVSIDDSNEGFNYQDLDTTNGTKTMNNSLDQDPDKGHWLASGSTLCLGKTYLRVKLREHEVPPAIPISFWDTASHSFGSPLFVIFSALILVIVSTYSQYFDVPRNDKLKEYLFESSYLIIIALIYASIWSFIARTQKLDGRFLVHMNLAIWFLILDSIYNFINPILLFNLGIPGRSSFLEIAVGCLLLYALFYCSSYLATRASKISRNLMSCVIPALVILFAVSKIYKAPDFSISPKYDPLIVSPAMNFKSGVSEEEFIEEASSLYRQADEQ